MPEWMQYGTFIIAVVGAVLGVINWLERWWLRRPRLKVSVAAAFVADISGVSDAWALEAINTGFVDTTLSFFHFEILTKSTKGNCEEEPGPLVIRKQIAGPRFPHKLCARESCTVYVSPRLMAQGLIDGGYGGCVKLRGFYKDQLGRKYRSKRFQFDINRWAKTPEWVNYPETPLS